MEKEKKDIKQILDETDWSALFADEKESNWVRWIPLINLILLFVLLIVIIRK